MELKLKRLGKEYTVFLDDEDAEKINGFTWQIQENKTGIFYARGNKKINGKWVGFYMHRVLMNPEGREVLVDHINGNGLDNRKANLRYATKRTNAYNSKPNGGRQVKGVEFYKGRWATGLLWDGIRIHMGRYDTKEEALRVYDKVASKLYGEFARLNFPDDIAS